MRIESVYLENFRNIQGLDLNFDQGFVVLNGANGAGKTNFLEALYFGATLGRFPESSLGDLFLNKEKHFRVEVVSHHGELDTRQEVFYEHRHPGLISVLKINKQKVLRKEYLGNLPVVKFLPQELTLLTGSPVRRRRFLDDFLSQTSAKYDHDLKQYERGLRQRNELLFQLREKGGEGGGELDMWDENLLKYGSAITQHRRLLFEFINEKLESVLKDISPELIGAGFVYTNSGEADTEGFLKKLQSVRAREREAGVSLVGPHRDEFRVRFRERDAVGFVSRGQTRSLVLALKFLERDFIVAKTGRRPIILLDDVLSEFDADHQRNLINFLRNQEQVFVTTAHDGELKSLLPSEAQVFTVTAGRLMRQRDV